VGAGVKPSKQTKTNKSKGKKRRRKTSQLQQQWTKEVYNNNISFLLPGAKHSRLHSTWAESCNKNNIQKSLWLVVRLSCFACLLGSNTPSYPSRNENTPTDKMGELILIMLA
jgi:hypothetical protein